MCRNEPAPAHRQCDGGGPHDASDSTQRRFHVGSRAALVRDPFRFESTLAFPDSIVLLWAGLDVARLQFGPARKAPGQFGLDRLQARAVLLDLRGPRRW